MSKHLSTALEELQMHIEELRDNQKDYEDLFVRVQKLEGQNTEKSKKPDYEGVFRLVVERLDEDMWGAAYRLMRFNDVHMETPEGNECSWAEDTKWVLKRQKVEFGQKTKYRVQAYGLDNENVDSGDLDLDDAIVKMTAGYIRERSKHFTLELLDAGISAYLEKYRRGL